MQLHLLISDAFPRLRKFKEENDKRSFNESMKKLLPGINRYVATWLHRAVINNSIPAGKYKVADFVDELYIQSYDHFHQVNSSEHLSSWLFKKADQLLDDTKIEEEFDHFFFENIDNYTKVEWEEMEEKYSTDSGGDMVMIAELDDTSYPKNDYILADVFIEDNDKEVIEKLDEKFTEEQISRHIDMVLNLLSTPASTVFELAVRDKFQVDEIALIKRITVREVKEHLAFATEKIQVSFEKRYLRNLLGR